MKFISWTIWIVSALLVIATLDTVQDPPAVNPGTALCKILHLHAAPCGTVSPRRESTTASSSFPVSLVSASASVIYRPSDQTILTGQAADPSPPSKPASFKAFTQSL